MSAVLRLHSPSVGTWVALWSRPQPTSWDWRQLSPSLLGRSPRRRVRWQRSPRLSCHSQPGSGRRGATRRASPSHPDVPLAGRRHLYPLCACGDSMEHSFPRLLYLGVWDALGNAFASSVNKLERHGRASNSMAVVTVPDFPAAAGGEELRFVTSTAHFNDGHVTPTRYLIVASGADDDCKGKDRQHGSHHETATTSIPIRTTSPKLVDDHCACRFRCDGRAGRPWGATCRVNHILW